MNVRPSAMMAFFSVLKVMKFKITSGKLLNNLLHLPYPIHFNLKDRNI